MNLLKNYTIGFILSLLLTVGAYALVVSGGAMSSAVILLGGLALLQLWVQLRYFFHLGEGTDSRIKLWSFLFMALILIIIVAGSIWIMYHLNYHMIHMEPEQKDSFMQSQRDKGF